MHVEVHATSSRLQSDVFPMFHSEKRANINHFDLANEKTDHVVKGIVLEEFLGEHGILADNAHIFCIHVE
jgi:hypothetical protein